MGLVYRANKYNRRGNSAGEGFILVVCARIDLEQNSDSRLTNITVWSLRDALVNIVDLKTHEIMLSEKLARLLWKKSPLFIKRSNMNILGLVFESAHPQHDQML